MKTKVIVLLVTFSVSVSSSDSSSVDKEDVKHDAAVFGVYNNISAYQIFNQMSKNNATTAIKQIPFDNPCRCENFECKCCGGIRIIGFGNDRLACAELIYDPRDTILNFELFINDNSVFRDKFSTRNRQVCVPILPITLVGPFDLCVMLYDMNVVEQRLHACLAMVGRLSKYPVLTVQFNCMEMGPGGIGIARPIGGIYNESVFYPLENLTNSTSETPQEASNILDPVQEK